MRVPRQGPASLSGGSDLLPLLIASIAPTAILAVPILFSWRRYGSDGFFPARIFAVGCLSCLPALLLELAGKTLMMYFELDTMLISMLLWGLVVPISEETSKYVAFNALRSKNEIADIRYGMLCGALVSLGFATIENMVYIINNQDMHIALMRAFTAIPMHFACGIYMGFVYSRAILSEGMPRDAKMRHFVLALAFPIAMHSLYDICVMSGSDISTAAGVSAMAVFFISSIVLAVLQGKETRPKVSDDGDRDE